MPNDAWQSAKELFRLALDQPTEQRVAFVTAHCADTAIRQEVLRLLRLHGETSDFLVSPVGPAPQVDGAADALIGRTLGGFVIQRVLAFGGMGAVYEALQEQPHRRAAVKVLRPGLFAPRLQRRFEFESEILGKLHHPGIAQIFAAGTFEAGDRVQPWFAMELIEGPPLLDYARKAAAPLPQIVELLIAVCDAVQHAHQRGVIHRDLKPDNILIDTGAGGASGQPKVLDFGVARSIDADMQATLQTAAGEIVGTLAYMSPEQVSGNSERVDARSDVFALGVIAYELFTGQLPHGRKGASLAEMIKAIEHDDPRPPGSINAALRGDLEVIVMKALEKDMGRRYQSVAELATDLRRYRNDEPISARPATALYQLRKFARRNRALVMGAATTVLALVAGLILYANEARIARREAVKSQYEADKATAINNFIANDFLMKLLAAANTSDSTARLPIADLVRQASEQAGPMFSNRPSMEAAVRNEIGSIQYNLGAMDRAADEFERALELWEKELGPDHPDTLKAVNNLGQCRAHQRRGKEAEALYLRALEARRRVLGDDDPYTLVTTNNLAELYRGSGRVDEAEAMMRRALESQTRILGPNHKNTITTLGNLANLLFQSGRRDEALDLYRRAHASSVATLGRDHVMSAMTAVRLGDALQRAERALEAEPLLVDVVEILNRTLGPDHSETIMAHRVLARAYHRQKKRDQAIEQLRLALEGARAKPERFSELAAKIQSDLDKLSK